MACIGTAAILMAMVLFVYPIAGGKQIDLQDGPPLSWLWALAFLASGVMVFLGR